MKLRTTRTPLPRATHTTKSLPPSIEPLESRIAPASIILGAPTDMDVTFSTGTLTIADTAGSVSDADLTISLSGTNIHITDPTHTFSAFGGATLIDPHTVEVPINSITSSFSILAADGDDSLFIDYSGGNPLPSVGMSFDGGIGTNTLTVGGGSATNITHSPQGLNNGDIQVDSTSISYANIEGLTDTMVATARILNFGVLGDTITLASGSGFLTTLTSDHSVAIQFASPTSALLLDSNGGDDHITVTSLNPSFTGVLGIVGYLGDDTITLTATSPGYNGVVSIDGEGGTDTLTIGSAFTADNITATAETITPLPLFKVGVANADLTASLVSFQTGGGLSYKILGTGNSPFFGQLKVTGALNLTGAALDITASLTSLPTAPLTIVDLAGTDPAVGTFNGLAEGASYTLNGANFLITYVGGTGNDVQLIPVVPPPIGVIKLGSLDGTNGFKIYGQTNGDRLGQSVSGAGDVNGDGVGDFIIGANHATAGSDPNAGVSYVVFGSPSGFPPTFALSSLNGINGFKIEGAAPEDNIGQTVSKAGDVNGDGLADILVSAPLSNGYGATYVIFGSGAGFSPTLSVTALNGANGFKIQGSSNYDRAAHVSSSAGDVNGDGATDILIGIRNASNLSNSIVGVGYVVFGHASASFTSAVDISALNGTDGFRIEGATGGGQFGASVSTAGDINGDGFADILIGADHEATSDATLGAAYVVFGKSATFPSVMQASALDGKTGFRIIGGHEAGYVGASVTTAGDMNGDGLSDILIGAPESNGDVGGTGTGYVVFGKRKGYAATFNLVALNGTNGFALAGEINGNLTGGAVGGVGDFNGDGFDDILIGATRSDTNGFGSGTSYLVFGRPGGFSPILPLSTLNGTTGFKLLGTPGSKSGTSVGGAGDVNGDGLPDIIIGAPFGGFDAVPTGAAHVLYGSGASHPIPVTKAAGKTLTYTDVDGDLVSVTVNKGKITPEMLTFGPGGGLFMVDLTAGGTFKDGANVTFTVGKKVGNGIINVGAIQAPGLHLGIVKITGDLGQIDVGTGNPLKPALKSITVGSLGMMGADMQLPGTINPLTSDITGNLPLFTIKGGFNLASINVSGNLGRITIGGDFNGTGSLSLSQLQGLAALGHGTIANVDGGITLANSGLNAGSIGSINVAGTITNAAVNSSGSIGSVTVTGSVKSGAIVAAGALRVVKIFGSITSDDASAPSVIAALAAVPNSKPAGAIAINTFLVKGDVKNAEILIGYNKDFIATNSDASIGTFTVKGIWAASSLAVGIADVTADGFGRNDRPFFAGLDGSGADLTPKIISRIASLTIGTLLTTPADGTAADGDFFGITAELIVKAKINGVKIPLVNPTKDALNKDIIPLGTFGDFFLVEV